MKRTTMMALGVAVCLIGVGVARAGNKSTSPLTVDPINRTAFGSLADTRASADPTASFGCWVIGASSGTAYSQCYLTANNKSYSCLSFSSAFVQAAQSVSSDSYIYLAWDATGTCTLLEVNNGSSFKPKQP